MSTKYAIKNPNGATVWTNNPHATGDMDMQLQVRTLPQGTVIDVISEGQTRTSYSATPVLNIGNNEWVNKSDVFFTPLPSNTGATVDPVEAARIEAENFRNKDKMFSTKNIVIGSIIIISIFGLLKWQKVF